MSRVAKNPVLFRLVWKSRSMGQIVVKGPLGSLAQAVHPSVKVERGDGVQCSAIEGAVNARPCPAPCVRWSTTW
jgi:hypothetical protein